MENSEVIEVLEKEENYMLSHGGEWQAKALRIAIEKIKQEPRWIPVTERLPIDSGRYLVNYSSGYVAMAYFYRLIPMWNSTTIERIVAWMPIPEPYKEESEDKE